MKFYVLLHNQVMMAQASILNSPETWFPAEVEEVVYQLRLTLENYRTNDRVTDYQYNKLMSLIDNTPLRF